jgi:hypothetical protein
MSDNRTNEKVIEFPRATPTVGTTWFIRIKGASALLRVHINASYYGGIWNLCGLEWMDRPWDGEEGKDFDFVHVIVENK